MHRCHGYDSTGQRPRAALCAHPTASVLLPSPAPKLLNGTVKSYALFCHLGISHKPSLPCSSHGPRRGEPCFWNFLGQGTAGIAPSRAGESALVAGRRKAAGPGLPAGRVRSAARGRGVEKFVPAGRGRGKGTLAARDQNRIPEGSPVAAGGFSCPDGFFKCQPRPLRQSPCVPAQGRPRSRLFPGCFLGLGRPRGQLEGQTSPWGDAEIVPRSHASRVHPAGYPAELRG